MLAPKLPGQQNSLVVLPREIRIFFEEDSLNPLSYVLPPYDDLSEIQFLKGGAISIGESVDFPEMNWKDFFQDELEALNKKYAKYSNSPKYLHRLATLQMEVGQNEKSEALHRRAYEISNELFFAHKLADNFLYNSNVEEAKAIFQSLNDQDDVYCKLRLASFAIKNSDFSEAKKYISDAIRIDPIDYSARLFEGGLHLYDSNFRQAIQSFRFAIQERPTSGLAHTNLAIAYLALQNEKKALKSIMRAVALDPLNESAVCLLSDIAYKLKRDDEAIPSLRYYLQFKQKHDDVWSRFARASLRIGNADEAIVALRRQASIKDTSAVWNNLGVAYLKTKNQQKALECFVHSMRIDEPNKTRNYFLAARNVISMFSENENNIELIKLAKSVLQQDKSGLIFSDEEISDVIPFYVNSLYQSGKVSEANIVSYKFLSVEGICDSLALWLVSALVSYNALSENYENIENLVNSIEFSNFDIKVNSDEKMTMFFNNVAFAFADKGDVSSAEKYLQRITHMIHKSAYPTATYGLLQFRKGKPENGIELYHEAISLATGSKDKARIKQKLNIELAKTLLSEKKYMRALRILESAAKDKSGDSQLSHQAKVMIAQINRLKRI